MKNSLLVFGGLLILINTTIGLVFDSYHPINMLFADFSILLTIGIMYSAFNSAMVDGFKIGLTVFFAITGIGRIVCAIASKEHFKNNISIVVFIVLLAIEILCFFVANALKDK